MSGRRYTACQARDSSASPSEIFALLSDSSTYPDWSSVSGYEMERPGFAAPHGVGEIRVLKSWPFRVREEIVELVPDRFMAYTLLSGLPMRDYRGETTLDPLPDGGTRVTWRSNFSGVLGTGGFMRLFMMWVLSNLTSSLVQGAEARVSSKSTPVAPQQRITPGSMPS